MSRKFLPRAGNAKEILKIVTLLIIADDWQRFLACASVSDVYSGVIKTIEWLLRPGEGHGTFTQWANTRKRSLGEETRNSDQILKCLASNLPKIHSLSVMMLMGGKASRAELLSG